MNGRPPSLRDRAARSPVWRALRLLVLVLATLPLAGPPARGAEAGLRIVAPRHLATVLGPTAIEVEVALGPGQRVDRLELRVDGELLATLSGPPWRVEWDAGDGRRGHGIEALLYLTDGSTSRASVRTSALRINERLEVDLVNLYPVVRDRAGSYVTGLTRDDFVILEDGEPQTIQRFTTEQRPLRVAIVLDASLSMSKQRRLENAQRAALGFLDVLQAQDEGLVVLFSDEVAVVQGITSDRDLLAAAIERAEAGGGTALYDAIWRTSRRLEAFDGRRVVVLLSDGRDEASNGFEPGSLHTLEEATTQALRSEVMVFTIGLGRNLGREFAREWTRPPDFASARIGSSLEQCGNRDELMRAQRWSVCLILASVAEATGGRLLLSPSPGKLRRAFAEIADDLRNQYSIAYSSSNEAKDGTYRKLRVLVRDRDVEVVVRTGYFAPTQAEGDADR